MILAFDRMIELVSLFESPAVDHTGGGGEW